MADLDDGGPLLDRLLAVTVLLGSDMDGALDRLGLTPARAQVLWLLGSAGPATQRDLARQLQVSPRNVTGLVDGLESAGLVSREAHPSDRRAYLVTPTAKGRRTIRGLRAGHAVLAEELFGAMAAPRRAELARALDELHATIERLLGGAPGQT